MLWFKRERSNSEIRPILIAGLGNPGREYGMTRHNIGFLVIDKLGRRMDINLNRVQNRTIIGKNKIVNDLIILAKPQSFMNNSGSPIFSLVKFYKVELKNLLVIHDDVDLSFGCIRLRPGGASPGHRGVDSIINSLGSREFPRLRLGIGRPPGNMPTPNYVLEKFLPSESDFLDGIIEKSVNAIIDYIENGIDSAMNRFNGLKE